MNITCADELVRIILQRLAIAHAPDRPMLIGVDGLAGSGKTTLCSKVVDRLRQDEIPARVMKLDGNYWRKNAQSVQVKFDCNKESVGEDYDWPAVREQLVLFSHASQIPDRVIIVEGVFALRIELRELYDLRVFVDTQRDLALQRALARDGEKDRHYYESYWRHEEDLYVSRHDPKNAADVVIQSSGDMRS